MQLQRMAFDIINPYPQNHFTFADESRFFQKKTEIKPAINRRFSPKSEYFKYDEKMHDIMHLVVSYHIRNAISLPIEPFWLCNSPMLSVVRAEYCVYQHSIRAFLKDKRDQSNGLGENSAMHLSDRRHRFHEIAALSNEFLMLCE